jgi:hypothetical protein
MFYVFNLFLSPHLSFPEHPLGFQAHILIASGEIMPDNRNSHQQRHAAALVIKIFDALRLTTIPPRLENALSHMDELTL